MIVRTMNTYNYRLLLGTIYFIIFAYDIETDRDFWTWLWLLSSIFNFIMAITHRICSNYTPNHDDEIYAISEYIQEIASHRNLATGELFAIEKFGKEKTKKAMDYLANN